MKARASGRLSQAVALRDGIAAVASRIDSTALEESSALYVELGDLYLAMGDPRASDYYLLATDLDFSSRVALRKVLQGLGDKRDFFVRLRMLRRLLDLEPGERSSAGELAERYLMLHVRLDEAVRLSRELHASGPDARSYLLLGRSLAATERLEEAKRIAAEGLSKFPKDPLLQKLVTRLK